MYRLKEMSRGALVKFERFPFRRARLIPSAHELSLSFSWLDEPRALTPTGLTIEK